MKALGLTYSLAFLFNLRNLYGTDILPNTYLQNYTYWEIYNSLPDDWRLVMTYSDNSRQDQPWARGTAYEVQGLLRFIAQEYGDRHAEWMAQHIINNTGRQINIYKTPYYIFEFFYYDPTITPTPPADLPLNRTFSDLEGVIWRTGWGPNDLTFALRTGPRGGRFTFNTYTTPGGLPYPFENRPIYPRVSANVNTGHDHADFNTFYLYRGNNILATEFSNYGYYQSSYHNVLLVDGQGQYFTGTNFYASSFLNTDAKLEKNYSTNNFSFLTADNTNTYRLPQPGDGAPGPKLLTESKRHVLFFKPNYLVMIDNVESGINHQYEWVYHAGASLSVEGKWVKGQGPNGQILGVYVAAPLNFQNTTGNDGYPYIRVKPASNTNNIRFVTVLYPTNSIDWSSKPTVTLLGENTEIAGVRVVRNGLQEDHLIKYGTAATETTGPYSLTGDTASIITNAFNGEPDKIFLGKVNKIINQNLIDQTNSHILVQSNASALLEIDHDGTSLFLDGDQISELVVYGPNISTNSVFLNGNNINVNKVGDYITYGNVPPDILAQITPPSSCTENWTCGAWSSCVNNSQSRTCTDSNNCGTTINRPTLSQACTPSCSPNWSCSAWSTCVNSAQSRTCTDSNNCGLTDGQPPLSQSCTIPPPPDPGCSPNWSCSAWSSCINNSQSRTCTDSNNCGDNSSRPALTQSCGTVIDHADTGNLLALLNKTGAAVYYIANNGKKYVYPDAKTYFTWYANFNKVQRVNTAKLDSYPDGGVMPYRAGVKLITHPNTAKVYAVEPDTTIRHIPSESAAKSLFGNNWSQSVQDVITGFFSVSYRLGDPLAGSWPTGSVVKYNQDYYYLIGQTKRKFTSISVIRLNNLYPSEAWIASDLNAYQNGYPIINQEKYLATFRPNINTNDLLGQDPSSLGDMTDTDQDGLGYYEETSVWKTNPALPDTDGDGYSDGTEIKNGFNPLGNGTIESWLSLYR